MNLRGHLLIRSESLSLSSTWDIWQKILLGDSLWNKRVPYATMRLSGIEEDAFPIPAWHLPADWEPVLAKSWMRESKAWREIFYLLWWKMGCTSGGVKEASCKMFQKGGMWQPRLTKLQLVSDLRGPGIIPNLPREGKIELVFSYFETVE